jgi:hypothetical protein
VPPVGLHDGQQALQLVVGVLGHQQGAAGVADDGDAAAAVNGHGGVSIGEMPLADDGAGLVSVSAAFWPLQKAPDWSPGTQASKNNTKTIFLSELA